MRHYNKLNDTQINWEGMKYPCGNRDIDRFEENNEGLFSINVHHEFDYDGKPLIAIHRRTNTIHATHHISLLIVFG